MPRTRGREDKSPGSQVRHPGGAHGQDSTRDGTCWRPHTELAPGTPARVCGVPARGLLTGRGCHLQIPVSLAVGGVGQHRSMGGATFVQAKAKLRSRVPAPRGHRAPQGERTGSQPLEPRSACPRLVLPSAAPPPSLLWAGWLLLWAWPPADGNLRAGQGRRPLIWGAPHCQPQPSPGLHLAFPTTAREPPPPWLGHSHSKNFVAPTAQASPLPMLSSWGSSSHSPEAPTAFSTNQLAGLPSPLFPTAELCHAQAPNHTRKTRG